MGITVFSCGLNDVKLGSIVVHTDDTTVEKVATHTEIKSRYCYPWKME